MIKNVIFWLLFCFVFFTNAQGTQFVWRHKACLPAPGRWNQASFILNNKVYAVGGYVLPGGSVADVWEYDPATDIWTQKNNFPVTTNGSTPFVINDTAYVCLGEDVSLNYMTVCYRYEQASDTWTQMANFIGPGRYTAMCFVLNNKAYVGCGKNGGENNDFYEYDPSTNTWTQKSGFPGAARQSGFAGAVGNFGYMGLGGSTVEYQDSYKYDPTTDTWTAIANFPTAGPDGPGYFVLNDSIYVVSGDYFFNATYTYCYLYDPSTDSWSPQPQFTCIAPGRFNAAAGFTYNGHGYIQFGTNFNNTVTYNDNLEFGPPDTTFGTRVSVIGNDTSYCGSFTRVLSTGDSCTVWSTGVIGPQITVTSAGSYWGFYDNGCGISIDSIRITNPSSTTALGNDTTYCGAFSRVLSTGIANTTWSTGATGAQITVTTAGTYWASATSACGALNDTIVISQLAAPQLALGGDSFLCTGQTLILNATNPNTTYHWQDNSSLPTYQVSSPGTYSVTATDTTSGCSTSASVNVMYSSQPPQVNLGPNLKVCGNDGATLSVPVANAHFVWNDGSTDSTYLVTASGTYSVTVSNGCSSASSEVNVSVYPNDCKLLIPTGFSPNGDGVNDIFHAISHCPVSDFSLHVYNRWGEKVYSTTNIQNGWDGTYKNLEQPTAVYVYYIDYMNYCEGKTEQIKGNVTLVR